MVINKDNAESVDLLWHGIIDPETGIMKEERYKLEDLVITMHRNPHTRNTDLVYVPYAVSVRRGKRVIAIIAIEQEDLRALAQNLGCSVRELQEEQDVRGNFGRPRVVAYAGKQREDLGPYEDKLDLMGAKTCLIEWACDTVDLLGEPVPLA